MELYQVVSTGIQRNKVDMFRDVLEKGTVTIALGCACDTPMKTILVCLCNRLCNKCCTHGTGHSHEQGGVRTYCLHALSAPSMLLQHVYKLYLAGVGHALALSAGFHREQGSRQHAVRDRDQLMQTLPAQ